MKKKIIGTSIAIIAIVAVSGIALADASWTFSSTSDWSNNTDSFDGILITDDMLTHGITYTIGDGSDWSGEAISGVGTFWGTSTDWNTVGENSYAVEFSYEGGVGDARAWREIDLTNVDEIEFDVHAEARNGESWVKIDKGGETVYNYSYGGTDTWKSETKLGYSVDVSDYTGTHNLVIRTWAGDWGGGRTYIDNISIKIPSGGHWESKLLEPADNDLQAINYLQTVADFSSDESITAQIGVDRIGDGKIGVWTDEFSLSDGTNTINGENLPEGEAFKIRYNFDSEGAYSYSPKVYSSTLDVEDSDSGVIGWIGNFWDTSTQPWIGVFGSYFYLFFTAILMIGAFVKTNSAGPPLIVGILAGVIFGGLVGSWAITAMTLVLGLLGAILLYKTYSGR